MRARESESYQQVRELLRIELLRWVISIQCVERYTVLTSRQRAFRQRKEGYIKKLEEQVKEFQSMESSFRALQNENYQLREYILSLQSRLLENQSDVPPAPSHINLPPSTAPAPTADSTSAVEQQLRREMQHQGQDPMSQLQAAAAAASEARPQETPYGLGGEHSSTRPRADDSVEADNKSGA